MIGLKEKYAKEVIPKMKERFGYNNDLAVLGLDYWPKAGFHPGARGYFWI